MPSCLLFSSPLYFLTKIDPVADADINFASIADANADADFKFV